MKRFLAIAIAASLIHSAFALDHGDGTYSNPMIHADYPDCEVIRVGKDFYYLSSSFHWSPGNPILHSCDLVNWKPVGFTIPEYNFDLRYNLDGHGNRYGAGSWAPTLRYHDGMFYSAGCVWTNGNKDGVFLVSCAKKPEGPWKMNVINEKLYDPGLFFDDDGRVYVVHGQNDYVTELDRDLRKVISPPKLIYQGRSYFEGSHVYKINGLYYLFNTGGGKQHALRAKNIYGPYEHKVVLDSELNYPGTGLHQGALVDTPTGEWWAFIFQDRGKHGRVPFLLPVKWDDGWPIVQPVMTCRKPDVGGRPQKIDEGWRSDDFNSPKLGLQWQWNHNPANSAWSLAERPGWLRLHTTRVVDVWRQAQNTLGQRILGPDSGAIVKLDVSKMKDGDYAGLGLFSANATSIAVVAGNGEKHLAILTEMSTGGGRYDKKEIISTNLESNIVWLRAEVPYLEYAVNYSYSFDGKIFTPLGETLGIPYEFFADWLAPRYSIYNYATEQAGGHVDFDSFDYILPKRQNNFYAFGDKMDAQFCDEFSPTNCSFKWIEDGTTNIYVQNPQQFRIGTGKHGPVSWTAALEAKQAGSWLKFNRVDFGTHAHAIQVRVQGHGKISIHFDDVAGELVAEETISSSEFANLKIPLKTPASGVRPIVVSFVPANGKTILLRQLVIQ